MHIMTPPIPMPTKREPHGYLGIDPGASGGLALIRGSTIRVSTMPETMLEIWDLVYGSSLCGPPFRTHAIIEKVHSMPKQGVTSAFTFGKGYGMLLMALTAASIPYEEIRPEVWQKYLSISPRKKGEAKPLLKLRLLNKAQQLFPLLPLWKKPKSKGEQLAVCDALLIAEYCRRTRTGG